MLSAEFISMEAAIRSAVVAAAALIGVEAKPLAQQFDVAMATRCPEGFGDRSDSEVEAIMQSAWFEAISRQSPTMSEAAVASLAELVLEMIYRDGLRARILS